MTRERMSSGQQRRLHRQPAFIHRDALDAFIHAGIATKLERIGERRAAEAPLPQ